MIGGCNMGYSRKRAKAVAEGKVSYCILLDGQVVFSSKSFLVAVQHADFLQKQNPDAKYEMKILED